jgi:predicted HTH transcriptional regulator
MIGNTATASLFRDIIHEHTEELPAGKPAPDHSMTSRVRGSRLPDDICVAKHGGDGASAAAFDRAKASRRQRHAELLEMLRVNGPMTTREIAEATGCDRNVYDPRCSELKAEGAIRRTGEMRLGCHVLALA